MEIDSNASDCLRARVCTLLWRVDAVDWRDIIQVAAGKICLETYSVDISVRSGIGTIKSSTVSAWSISNRFSSDDR